MLFACGKEPKDLTATIINDTEIITIRRKRDLISKYQLHVIKSLSRKFSARAGSARSKINFMRHLVWPVF